jgi:hypothetical protein
MSRRFAIASLLATAGAVPARRAKGPEEFAQYIRVDIDRGAKPLKAANFVPQ